MVATRIFSNKLISAADRIFVSICWVRFCFKSNNDFRTSEIARSSTVWNDLFSYVWYYCFLSASPMMELYQNVSIEINWMGGRAGETDDQASSREFCKNLSIRALY